MSPCLMGSEGREAIPAPRAVICRYPRIPYGETAPVHWRDVPQELPDVGAVSGSGDLS